MLYIEVKDLGTEYLDENDYFIKSLAVDRDTFAIYMEPNRGTYAIPALEVGMRGNLSKREDALLGILYTNRY